MPWIISLKIGCHFISSWLPLPSDAYRSINVALNSSLRTARYVQYVRLELTHAGRTEVEFQGNGKSASGVRFACGEWYRSRYNTAAYNIIGTINLAERSQYNLFRSVQIERNVFSEIVFLVLQFNTVNLGFDATSAENWFPFKDTRRTRPILFVRGHRDKRETSALSSALCQGVAPLLIRLISVFPFSFLVFYYHYFDVSHREIVIRPNGRWRISITISPRLSSWRNHPKGHQGANPGLGEYHISELSKSASSPLSKASRDFNRTEQSRAHPSYIYEIDIKHRVLQPLSVPKPPTIRLHLYLRMTQAAHAGQIAFDRRPKFLPLFYTPIRPPISSSHSYFSLLRNSSTCSVVTQLLIFQVFLTLLLWFFIFWDLWNCGYPQCQPFWEWD